ncbi:hypothetical protein, partial [Pseudorhodoferax sp. Leaf274]|uniref:hypothetical protein n=1 Tax=Pseudorhodoferax sp. Leaf274 TaxID=1736318 RepID=UPI0007035CFE
PEEHWLQARFSKPGGRPPAESAGPASDVQAQVVAQPDGRLHADGYFTWNKGKRPAYIADQGLPCDFYLARWSQHG